MPLINSMFYIARGLSQLVSGQTPEGSKGGPLSGDLRLQIGL